MGLTTLFGGTLLALVTVSIGFAIALRNDRDGLTAPRSERLPGLGVLCVLVGVAAQFGRRPVLYSGSLIKEQLGDEEDAFFGAHRLWLAEYGPVPQPQRSWRSPWLWQYSGDGIGPDPKTVPGIPGAGGAVDCNSYDGPPDRLAAEWAS